MSKMRKEYDPNKVKRISSAKEKKQRHFISNIFVHETAWWILSQFHQNIKRRNIW